VLLVRPPASKLLYKHNTWHVACTLQQSGMCGRLHKPMHIFQQVPSCLVYVN